MTGINYALTMSAIITKYLSIFFVELWMFVVHGNCAVHGIRRLDDS